MFPPTEIADFPPETWPPELTSLRPRKMPDGRRVVSGRDLAALLGCTPENLRKMAAAGKLSREEDLAESTRSWYRLEEVARAYLTKFPGRVVSSDDIAGLSEHWRSLGPAKPPLVLPAQDMRQEVVFDAEEIADAKDDLIRSLTEALAKKEAEVVLLQAELADPGRRRDARAVKSLRRRVPKS